MFLAQEAADILTAIPALYLNRVFALTGVICLVVLQLALRRPQSWPNSMRLSLLLVLHAVLETLALGSFLIGSEIGDRIGASIGFASFAAITAITAWIWLGEPVGWRRSFWMLWVAFSVGYAIFSSPI